MMMYDCNNTRIFNGDCIEEMGNIQCGDVNLVVTSPPYNMTKRKGGISDKSFRYDIYKDWMPEHDYINWIIRVFDKFNFVLCEDGVVLFNFSYSIENPSLPYKLVSEILERTNFSLVDTIVWKKKFGIPFPANKYRLSRIWEFVFVFCKKGHENNFRINRKICKIGENEQPYYTVAHNFIEAKNNDGKNNLNQASFSTDFVDKLIDTYGVSGSTVLDPFMGTGTTGVSCKKNNLKFIGIEISKNQCEYAIKRISDSSCDVHLKRVKLFN